LITAQGECSERDELLQRISEEHQSLRNLLYAAMDNMPDDADYHNAEAPSPPASAPPPAIVRDVPKQPIPPPASSPSTSPAPSGTPNPPLPPVRPRKMDSVEIPQFHRRGHNINTSGSGVGAKKNKKMKSKEFVECSDEEVAPVASKCPFI